MSKEKKRRARELGKDVLIVALVLSAVWLACRPQLYGRQVSEWMSTVFHHTAAIVPDADQSGDDTARMIQPVRMAAMTEQGRYGTPYDSQGAQTLFSLSAGLLNEALSSAGQPRRADREEWEAALSAAPGLYFEFAGALPLNTLADLLSGGISGSVLTHPARRVVLAVQEERVSLFYVNEEDGLYYRCDTDVVGAGQLSGTVSGLTPNGTLFAFERADCGNLAPCTMLPAQTPTPVTYLASSPLTEETEHTLLELLGFRVQGTSSYEAPDGTVYLNGGDSLRISDTGQVRFSAGSGEQARFPVEDGDEDGLRQCVETAGRLVRLAMSPWQGQAELQLTLYERQEDGAVRLEFDYYINGTRVVRYDGSSAASIQIQDGRITDFVMNLRTYTAGVLYSPVLPVTQAAAAVSALEGDGGELVLCYQDSGGENVTAGWIVTQ